MTNPWSVIEKPATDLNVRLVDDKHPLKLYWGVDSRSRYVLAYDATTIGLPQKKSLPNLSRIDIYIAPNGLRGKLVLLLQENANWELFYALCSDLVRATATAADETTGSAIILRRLQRWQELLRKTPSDILSLDEIKGLMGELLFLKDLLSPVFGYDAALVAWRGPEGAPLDFAIQETAIEVKCQSGSSKPVVRITSAEQLGPQLPRGYLAVYTLANQSPDEAGCLSLNSVVAEIRNALSTASVTSRERFEDLLYLAGYVTREEYDEYCFSVVSIKCYQLVEGFPRIVSSSLIPGVESVSYSIRLDACAPFLAKPQWWDKTL
jgi:hypothetical protein